MKCLILIMFSWLIAQGVPAYVNIIDGQTNTVYDVPVSNTVYDVFVLPASSIRNDKQVIVPVYMAYLSVDTAALETLVPEVVPGSMQALFKFVTNEVDEVSYLDEVATTNKVKKISKEKIGERVKKIKEYSTGHRVHPKKPGKSLLAILHKDCPNGRHRRQGLKEFEDWVYYMTSQGYPPFDEDGNRLWLTQAENNALQSAQKEEDE